MDKKRLAGVIAACVVAVVVLIVIFQGPPTPSGSCPPADAISWNEAKSHIGERCTVCGPVVDATWASSSNGKPTFLNLGRPYPDAGRFTVVIWIQYRNNFPREPEKHYLGKTICVTGLITEYKGIPEIEARLSSEIEICDP